MIITFPDGTLFDSSGAAGTLSFNSSTPPSIMVGQAAIYPNNGGTITAALWSRLQTAITNASQSGVATLSFKPEAPPVVTSASPSTFAHDDQPIIVLTGIGFQPGMVAGIDYAGIGGSGLPFVPVAVLTVVSPSKAYFTCPNLYVGGNALTVTLVNPDGGVAMFAMGAIT
jgi:hypothetical protein